MISFKKYIREWVYMDFPNTGSKRIMVVQNKEGEPAEYKSEKEAEKKAKEIKGAVIRQGNKIYVQVKQDPTIRKATGMDNLQYQEADERTPRKKGQHKGSSSHSDLYTDEDPRGTIHGLGFKDAATAKKGIGIINKSDRKHAHKVQATLVMQQRAKEAIKRTKDPEKKANLKQAYDIWTAHLEKLKAKTKEMNK